MDNIHIKEIQIDNFKCFQALKLNEIKQINLIGGKNNVGKTALLEAIELNSSSMNSYELIYNSHNLLKNRQGYNKNNNNIDIDFIYKNSNYTKIVSNLKSCKIKFGSIIKGEIINSEYNFFNMIIYYSINKDSMPLSIAEFIKTRKKYGEGNKHINYISPTKASDSKLAILYGSLVDLDREKYLDQSLSLFDENIIAMKQKATNTGIVIKLKLKNQNSLVLLSSLGDGINRYIAILCAIWANKDSILFIDEIENGIHFSNYTKLWNLIFEASIKANCQIFITSHSKECIQAFNQVQLENKVPSSAYFELYKNLKTDKITAAKRTALKIQDWEH